MKSRKKTVRRYHVGLWLPENIVTMATNFFQQLPDELGVTYHGVEQLLEDRRLIQNGDFIPTPTKRDLTGKNATLVEVHELLDKFSRNQTGIIQKLVVRVHHFSAIHDFTYVVSRDGFIVSGWSNDKTDVHEVDHREYYIPKSLRVEKSQDEN